MAIMVPRAVVVDLVVDDERVNAGFVFLRAVRVGACPGTSESCDQDRS